MNNKRLIQTTILFSILLLPGCGLNITTNSTNNDLVSTQQKQIDDLQKKIESLTSSTKEAAKTNTASQINSQNVVKQKAPQQIKPATIPAATPNIVPTSSIVATTNSATNFTSIYSNFIDRYNLATTRFQTGLTLVLKDTNAKNIFNTALDGFKNAENTIYTFNNFDFGTNQIKISDLKSKLLAVINKKIEATQHCINLSTHFEQYTNLKPTDGMSYNEKMEAFDKQKNVLALMQTEIPLCENTSKEADTLMNQATEIKNQITF